MPGPHLCVTGRPTEPARSQLILLFEARSSLMQPLRCHGEVKSGKKVPTAVQKVYLRLRKKVHELCNKLFPAVSLPQNPRPGAASLVINVLTR